MAWPIVQWNGAPHYQAQGHFLVPVDPSTGAAIIMLREDGGVGSGFAAIEKGDPGPPPTFLEPVYTPLAWNDPSPSTLTQIVVTPPTSTTAGVYKWAVSLHEGRPGDDGDTVLDPADFGGGTAGQTLVLNGGATAFVLSTPKITECFYPGSVRNTASGNANSTIATVAIPSRPWARRVRPIGYTVVTGEASDVRVDLLARLSATGDATGGNVVALCQGITQTERLTMLPGKPAGSADTFDQIAANASATVYVRCERQAGSVTYTTSGSSSWFSVETIPV